LHALLAVFRNYLFEIHLADSKYENTGKEHFHSSNVYRTDTMSIIGTRRDRWWAR